MLLKLAALGALGYAGYRYYQQNMQGTPRTATAGTPSRQTNTGQTPNVSDPQVALAGGPLSNEAAVMHRGEPLAGH